MMQTVLQEPCTTLLTQKTDMVFETKTEQETFDLGVQVGEYANAGDVICLRGDLGCGKTVFTAGVAKGLGIETPICSPTFTILQVYDEGSLPLYHFDVYRIADPDEMYEIGFDEYISGDGVCLIEWADLIEDILPKSYMKITIEKDDLSDADHRKISVERAGS